MELLEIKLKKRLIEVLKTDFDVYEDPEMVYSLNNKKLKPDLIIIDKIYKLMYVIEIKGDVNYYNQLIRQSVNYRFSTFEDKYPECVFMTTDSLLNGFFDTIKSYFFSEGLVSLPKFRKKELLEEFGVGILFLDYFKNKLRMICTKDIWEYDIKAKTSKILNKKPLDYMVGTNTSSNICDSKQIEYNCNTTKKDINNYKLDCCNNRKLIGAKSENQDGYVRYYFLCINCGKVHGHMVTKDYFTTAEIDNLPFLSEAKIDMLVYMKQLLIEFATQISVRVSAIIDGCNIEFKSNVLKIYLDGFLLIQRLREFEGKMLFFMREKTNNKLKIDFRIKQTNQ